MNQKERQKWLQDTIDHLLVEKFGDEGRLEPDQPLQEAGLDSVDVLDTLAALEKRFSITFERDELVGIATLRELYEVVYEQLVADQGEDFNTE